MTKQSILRGLKEYALITFGILLYVTGWSIFLVPNNLIGGGMTGVASIVQYATHGTIKMGYTYFFSNIILLILAIRILGRNFGAKTVYAIVVASLGLNFLQDVIPSEICQILAVDNGKLMSDLMGGLMVGVGIGVSMSQGGSTGGTDIIALIVNKYRNVSPGRMLLAMDAVILLSSMLVPSYLPDGSLVPFADKITNVVYGFILVMTTSAVTDLMISGSRQSVQLFILSNKYEQIADSICNELHRGCTVIDGQGWYTKNTQKVIMVITRKTDLNLFLRHIKQIDPDAFLSVGSVTGVYGKGFDTIKSNRRQGGKKQDKVA